MKHRNAPVLVSLVLLAGCARSPDNSALKDEVTELKARNAQLDETYRQELKTAQATAEHLQREIDALTQKQKDDNVQVYSDVIKAMHGFLDNFDDKINRASTKIDSTAELLKTDIRSVRAELGAKADNGRVTELRNRTLGEDEDLAVATPAAPLKNQIGELARLLVAENELETPGGLATTEAKGTFEKRLSDLEENVLAIDNRIRTPAQ
jgi:outer membrane murein-binding lipoprotein Lpp